MFAACKSSVERLDLERKVLAAAFKLSFDNGDKDGAALAHKGLCSIIQQQLFAGDGSSGSVVPAGFWEQAQQNLENENNAAAVEATAQQSLLEETGSGVAAAQAFAQITAAAANADANTGGGPLDYLDFGSAEESVAPLAPAPAGLSAPADISTPPAAPVEALTPAQRIKTQTFYEMLGVNKLSSYERIHICFLRLVRMLLRRLHTTQVKDKREFREILRTICIAHDVLKDPITRTDYDLRQMGMRTGGVHMDNGSEGKNGSPGGRIRLRLGELLECASVLEPKELQIALDMHKAEPGVQFGEFLVTSGFLNREELDSALMAQRLIDSGKITVAQFQSAIAAMRENGNGFFDTLMVEGWLTPRDVFDENSDLWKGLNGATEEPAVTETVPSAADNASKQQANDLMQAAIEAERALLNFIDTPDNAAGAAAIDCPQPASTDNSNENDTDDGDTTEIIKPSELGIAARLLQQFKEKKIEFNDKWTELDAMAETQSIDMTAVKTLLDSHIEEKD